MQKYVNILCVCTHHRVAAYSPLTCITEKREWIAQLRNDSKKIKELNDQLEANINVLQHEVDK